MKLVPAEAGKKLPILLLLLLMTEAEDKLLALLLKVVEEDKLLVLPSKAAVEDKLPAPLSTVEVEDKFPAPLSTVEEEDKWIPLLLLRAEEECKKLAAHLLLLEEECKGECSNLRCLKLLALVEAECKWFRWTLSYWKLPAEKVWLPAEEVFVALVPAYTTNYEKHECKDQLHPIQKVSLLAALEQEL